MTGESTVSPAAEAASGESATSQQPRKKQAPEFGASRLLLVATGAACAAYLPFWVNWLRETYPDLEVKISLTSSAEWFVTAQTLSLLNSAPTMRDKWSDAASTASHVDLDEWADAIAVFPASANYIAKLALGLCDSPSLLAMQSTRAVIGIAPSLPPGLIENPVYNQHVRALEERDNITVAPTHRGRSATTGRIGPGVAVPMWVLIEHMEKKRALMSAAREA